MSSKFLLNICSLLLILQSDAAAADTAPCSSERAALVKAEETYKKSSALLPALDAEYNLIVEQLPLWNAQLVVACGSSEPQIAAEKACVDFAVPSSSRYCPRKYKPKRVRTVSLATDASDRAKARVCKSFKRSMGTFLKRYYCKPLACNDLKTDAVNETEKALGAARAALDQCLQGGTTTVVNFESIQIGTKYPIGQGFQNGDVSVAIEPLTYHDGSKSGPDDSGWQPVAEVMIPWFIASQEEVPANSGFTELSLYPGNVRAKFSWSGCATEISFSVWDGGGDTNLGLNSVVKNLRGIFAEMNQVIDGAQVTVSNVGNTNHFAKVVIKAGDACLKSLTFGGQESLIDTIAIKRAASAQ